MLSYVPLPGFGNTMDRTCPLDADISRYHSNVSCSAFAGSGTIPPETVHPLNNLGNNVCNQSLIPSNHKQNS